MVARPGTHGAAKLTLEVELAAEVLGSCRVEHSELIRPMSTSAGGGGRPTRTADGAVACGANSRIKNNRRRTAKLVRRLSEGSIQSPTMIPEYVVLEVKTEVPGVTVRKSVYVSEQNGTRTLDLYSGWNPESQKHKQPLKDLPVKVCQLHTLERLWVSHNQISSLPPQLDQLNLLRELFLHKNNFEEIPTCVCKLPSLQVLWFSNNKITSIPDEVSLLTSLKRLHLDNNFITTLPPSLCELCQLEVLYLNHNTIHEVSDSIGKLKNLKRLYLQHNMITELPRGFTRLTSIAMLLLDNNEIRNLKREIATYQATMEAKGSVVSINNNPFVTPHGKVKVKLSLVGIGGSGTMPHLKTRRYSDQYEREALQRPARMSLPGSSDKDQIVDHRADTLPRSTTKKHAAKELL